MQNDTYLGYVEAGCINHGVPNGAQRLKLAGFLQQLLKQRGVMLGAVYSHSHRLLPRLVHSVQTLSPALYLVFVHHRPAEDLSPQIPAAMCALLPD